MWPSQTTRTEWTPKHEQLNEGKANERQNTTRQDKKTIKRNDRRLHQTNRRPSPNQQNCRVNSREMNRNPKKTQARTDNLDGMKEQKSSALWNVFLKPE